MSEVQVAQLTPDPGSGSDPFVGTPYRAVARLAAGGVGEVYLVEQIKLGKQFAAKVLHSKFAEEARLLERMRLEAESLGSLKHANIVAVIDFQRTADKRPFVVMEYLRGRTLADDIASRGPIAPEEALEFTCQLLSALQAAHEIGIVHRDIKPSNLFLCDALMGTRQLKVLDFGVVRVLPDAPAAAPDPTAIPTATGIVVGTPRYLSPEGALGMKVDNRADLYAAALMLYIMVAGRGPFDELTGEQQLLDAHAHREPPPPSHFLAQPIPSDVEALILKGLAKEPAQRFQTAEAFKQVIERQLALLRCPPQLRETNLVGSLREKAKPDWPAPVQLAFEDAKPKDNLRFTLRIATILFVLVAAITALVLLTREQLS